MKYSRLIILFLILTFIGIGLYNNYEMNSKSSSFEEPIFQKEIDPPVKKKVEEILLPEDLPTEINSENSTNKKESYAFLPENEDERGELYLDDALSGEGFIEFKDLNDSSFYSIDFKIQEGKVVGLGDSSLTIKNQVLCVSFNYSTNWIGRCFTTYDKINETIYQVENKKREAEEEALFSNNENLTISQIDEDEEQYSQSNGISYHFGDDYI